MILAPLLAHLRGWKPATLFFSAAAVYVVFGAISLAPLQLALSQASGIEPTYHDRYSAVFHGHFLVNISIGMTVLGAITWVQTRFGAMRYPAGTKSLFWILNIALIGSISLKGALTFGLQKPRRYIDYPELIETFVLINAWSILLLQTALFGLLCLLLWSIIARWLLGSISRDAVR